MGVRPNWTQKEYDYLLDSWGKVSIPTICKKLGRSENAIKVKVQRLGLGAFLEQGDYVTLNQLLMAVTGTNSGYGYKTYSWVENRGFPIHTKKVSNNSFKVVYIDEFWTWAEKNRCFLDFSKMEPLILGEEPDWVPEQRKKDFRASALQRKDPWSKYEDDKLKHLLKQHKYGYAELAKELNRTDGAIQRRICDLGLKERPVRANNHNPWQQQEYDILAEMLNAGNSYGAISEVIGRSEKAIRGRVYAVYKTENADKVRAMLNGGEWGDGKPEPTVRHEKRKSGVKLDIQRLQELLLYRRNELGYEPYWQRHMCQNWHDIKGCTANCTDCDSCTEFRRIKPQYCVRCGGTFYERQENRYCESCRKARKKQRQRKWAALQAVRVF